MSTNNLKHLREQLGLSQKALAGVVGLSQGSISNYECQRQLLPPTVAQRVIALAAQHGLKISYDDIYGNPSPTTKELSDDNHNREWSLFAGDADAFKRYLALKMRRAVQTGVGDVSLDDNYPFIKSEPSLAREKEAANGKHVAL